MVMRSMLFEIYILVIASKSVRNTKFEPDFNDLVENSN